MEERNEELHNLCSLPKTIANKHHAAESFLRSS